MDCTARLAQNKWKFRAAQRKTKPAVKANLISMFLIAVSVIFSATIIQAAALKVDPGR
jgi:ribosomal protein L23